MVGSAFDGEDVVQDALTHAMEALPMAGHIENPQAWLLRIAHNTALDLLRRRKRRGIADDDAALADLADERSESDVRVAATASLGAFMHLPTLQRSSVLLSDVLGYSLAEIAELLNSSIAAVKAALHRGRAKLREFAESVEDGTPPLPQADRARLRAYAERFNARDFDAVRDMLADDVRLDLVGRLRFEGRDKVGAYFGNYASHSNWRFAAALVDGQPAIIVQDPDDPDGRPRYFVVLGWAGDKLVTIRDFVFARYALDGAEIVMLA